MKSPARPHHLVIMAFGLLLAVLLTGGVLGLTSLRQLNDQEAWVTQAHEVLDELDRLLASLTDAETGVRGYLLTHDERFLQPYDDALPQVQERIDRLRQFFSRSPAQQHRLAELEPKVAARLDFLRQILALAKKGEPSAAVGLVQSGVGKSMHDELRSRVGLLRQTEEDQLRRRTQEAQGRYRTTIAAILLPDLIGVGLMGAVCYLAQRNLRRQEQGVAVLAEQKERLEQSEERFRLAAEAVNAIIYECDLRTNHVERSRGLYEVVGYRAEEVPPNADWWLEQVHPEDWPIAHERAKKIASGEVPDTLYRVRHRDGRWLCVEDRAVLIKDQEGKPARVVGCTVDVTARTQAEEELRRSEALLAGQKEALRAAVNGAPLARSLAVLIKTATEQFGPNARAAFYLSDPKGECLHHVVGMPAAYAEAVDGFRVGPESLACGLAVHTGQPVITPDVMTDRLWEPWRWLAQQFDYRGCWSFPITTATGLFAGTLAFYFRQPRTPVPGDQEVASVLTQTAAIIIAQQVEAENRAQTERERADLLARLDSLIDNAPIGIALFDPQLRFLSLNDRAAVVDGIPKEAHLGKTVSELMPELGPKVEALLQQVRDTGEPLVGLEVTGETPASPGESRCWLASYYPVRDGQGGVLGIGAVALEITAQKRAEAALREIQVAERERATELEAVLRATPTPIWIAHDPQCRRVTGNPASYRLLGLPEQLNVSATPAEPLFRPFQEYQNGKPIPPHELPMQRAAATGVAVHGVEMSLVFGDGHERHIYGNTAPILKPDGTVRGSVAAFMDITELKEAQTALRNADRRKDEFLATLAHELRNPLAPMLNWLEALKQTRGDQALFEQARSTMERQISQMVRLIDDLLDISRITRNRLNLKKERVDLAAVIEDALEACRSRVQQAGHELSVTLPAQPIALQADPVRLAQVFTNLLTNSCKYMEPGGRIWLTAERQGSEAVVTVKDTGLGIPPEMLTRVFDLFTQVDRSLERSQGGLGIGLSLVKRLVEMHQGTVTAHSEGLGRGSAFIVRLPVLIEKTASEPSFELPLDPLPVPRRILVVDDDRDIADSLAMILRMKGSETQIARDGLEAVEAAASFRPDVILMDIGMPRLNGYDACRRIREQPRGQEMVIIALSGWGQDEDIRKSQEAGFNHHLVKPVKQALLMKLLNELQPVKV